LITNTAENKNNNMAAGKYSFVIEQGSTFQRDLVYKDSDGAPIDLSNYSSRMQIRPSPGSATLYLTLSSSLMPDGTGLNMNGISGLIPAASGTIGIVISAASASMLTFDEAAYDLEIYSGSYASRIIEGKVKLSKEITTI
jgi:hypothetical protein